jgi:hypothetical protein
MFNFRRSELASPDNFTSWLTTADAHVAQLVEHVLGKDEVTGSIPVMGSSQVKYPDDLSEDISSKSI